MRGLSVEDLLPLEEYAGRRREFFEAHGRYLERCRHVRIGPRLTLIFENRKTLWFRVQEVLCIARLVEPALVLQELELYNRLLPSRNCLQAAMRIEVEDESQFRQELAPWQDLQGNQLCLHVGDSRYSANLFTCRPEDRCIGTTHWVQFVLDAPGRRNLANPALPAYCSCTLASYPQQSQSLTDETRNSLLEDLELSERDV